MNIDVRTREQAAYHRLMRVTLQMPSLSDDDCAAIDLRLGEVARTFKTGGSGVSVVSVAIDEAHALIRQRVASGESRYLCGDAQGSTA